MCERLGKILQGHTSLAYCTAGRNAFSLLEAFNATRLNVGAHCQTNNVPQHPAKTLIAAKSRATTRHFNLQDSALHGECERQRQ